MFEKPNKNFAIVLLLFIGIIFLFLSVLSEGSYAGADDTFHYLHSRWGFRHPDLLFNHWAKPFFTLVCSPFAQFGHMGVKLMNILLALITAYFTKGTCDKLSIKNGNMVIVFVLFMPVYTMMLLGGNNEIMTAFFLILFVFLFLHERYIIATLAISFLPLIRNETIILFPFFLAALIIKKKYKILPLILTGFVLFSIAGYFIYRDIFWLITRIPYKGNSGFLGHGESLIYFIRNYKFIFGLPLSIAILTGIIVCIKQLFFFKKEGYEKVTLIYLLIYLPILVFFFAHSYVWWKGIGGSGGRIRVMACITPLSAIVALQGVNLFERWINKMKYRYLNIGLGFLFLVTVIIYPFYINDIPVPPDKNVKYLYHTYYWLKKKNLLDNRTIYLQDPRLMNYFTGDPFEKGGVTLNIPNWGNPEKEMKPGDLVIYDIHFAKYQHLANLEDYLDNPYYRLIHSVQADQPFTLFNNEWHSTFVYVFQRMESRQDISNREILKNSTQERLFQISDMPEMVLLTGKDNTGNTIQLKEEEEFSQTYIFEGNRFNKDPFCRFHGYCDFTIDSKPDPGNVYLVLAVVKEIPHLPVKNIYYNAWDFSEAFQMDSNVYRIYIQATMDEKIKKTYILKYYIWNPGKRSLNIDALKLYHEKSVE